MEKITKSSDKVLIDPNEPLILPDGTALVGRVEWFLYALCCLDYQNLPTPMSRIEEFANALITGEIPNIQPQSRAEQFFLAILDGNISDLPQPQSRSEVLLDKLARGEFDLSDVEPIQSSYELLLAYLIKNGGIGNIDYVLYEFSEAMKTMYNTVEKPFKSLELSGNTLVNCVLEDTENDDYTSFDKDYSGTSFTINGTSEGAIKSATLKGQTLVNLVPKKIIDYTASSDWDGFHVLVQNSTKPNEHWRTLQDLKPNTKYYISCYVETFEDVNGRDYHFNNSNQNCLFVDFMKVNGVGHYQWISTTRSELTDEIFIALRCQNAYARGAIKIRDIMIIEYQEGMENWEIPYFTGMQSVKLPVLTTIGKNLYPFDDINFMPTNLNTWYMSNGVPQSKWGKALTHDCGIGEWFYLEEGYYSVSCKTTYDFNFHVLAEGEKIVASSGENNRLFSSGWYTIRIKSSPDTLKNISFSNIQIEQGTQATSYEPYKTNILTVNEDVELRKVGDAQDELNLLTGEFTERVGEIVLNGSEDWRKNDIYPGTTGSRFALRIENIKQMAYGKILCNKMQEKSDVASWQTEGEYISADEANISQINIRKTQDMTLEEFKEWLSQNPITVQYQLAESTVKTVDLNVVDQNNTKIDKIHVFNEITHVNASSDELTPTVNIGKSVSYPTIIKPNTKYTVDLKRNDKPLTVNLGGTEVTFASGETRKTITTPSTLTNDKLSYYGVGAKCNEIMLIEGEIERNIDYFTGMQSVEIQNQMPILHTVGKNLFDGELITGKIEDNGKPNTYVSSMCMSANYTRVQPNTTYNYKWIQERNNSRVFFYDVNKNFIKKDENAIPSTGGQFTTPSNCYYILFHLAVNTGMDSYTVLITKSNDLTYEPHKSSILSYNDDVTLRGIGDVRDTLDCLTGEIVERVGVGVFDGSEDEGWQLLDSNDNYVTFVTYRPLPNIKDNKNSICDKLPFQGHMTPEDGEYHSVQSFGSYINVLSSKASNVVEFKNWLSQNNLTIYYPLTTESIKTVDLSVVDQDGNTIPKVKSYNNVTHLEVTIPKQSLLPHISAEVATDNSKDMSSLTTKHQEISEAQSTIEDNIQSQSDEIDTALMATTEIFESILE